MGVRQGNLRLCGSATARERLALCAECAEFAVGKMLLAG